MASEWLTNCGRWVAEAVQTNPGKACLGLGLAAFGTLTYVLDCDIPTYFSSVNKNYFEGKVVWVTGASSGLGLGMAKRIAECGARVVLSARNEQKLNAVKSEIEAKGGRALVVPIDLSKIDGLDKELERLYATVKQTFGPVDILVNNAGMSQRTMAWEMTTEQDLTLLNLNFTSCILLAKVVLADMRARGSGHLVNVSSIAAPLMPPTRSMYTATKNATIAYHNALRWETMYDGITITNILPGPVNTNVDLNSFGKDGGLHGKKDPLMLTGMKTERAAELMTRAISNKAEESWPTVNPYLTMLYFKYYVPSVFRFLHGLVFSRKMQAAKRMAKGAADMQSRL